MKKLWFNIGIFFGCFLLLITTLGAVLIMAPGMELLGVMFIRSTSGSVDSKQTLSDVYQFENILVESDNIPVEIEFIQSNSIRIELVEHYDGFAKAGDTPNVVVEHRGDTIAIKSQEYVPFLAHSRSEDSGLKVKVPMYYTKNITVSSRKSSVVFTGLGAVVEDITVATGGEVKFNSDLKMHALKLSLKNENAIIADTVIMDGNIVAESKSGDLTLPGGFYGRVDYSSNSGNLFVNKCAQLSFKSKTGSLSGVNGEHTHIYGDADINTGGKIEIGGIEGAGYITAGNRSVTIGEKDAICTARLDVYSILGDINLNGVFTNSESKIKTKYGDINAEILNYANLETKSGDIKVYSSSNEANIITKSGKVSVELASGSLNIKTKNGKVFVGSDDYVIENANIETKSGNINILNAGNGEITLNTDSGDINFTQATSYKSKLTVKANKSNVVLNKLTGETNVETNRKITAYVHDVNEPINLTGKNKNVEVHVRKICYVDLESKSKIESAPGLEENSKKYRNAPESENRQIITVKTNRGKISVIVD